MLQVVAAAAIVFAGTVATAFHFASVLRDPNLSTGFMSRGLWQTTVFTLGGEIHQNAGVESADVPLVPLTAGVAGLSVLAWLAGASWISRRRQVTYSAALSAWGRNGWLWWLVPIAWEMLEIACDIAGSTSWQALCRATLPICHSTLWAGWLTTFVILVRKPAATASPHDRLPADGNATSAANPTRQPGNALTPSLALRVGVPGGSGQDHADRIPRVVWSAMAVYFVCFAAMNWLLYESLLMPHGDSGMYEEHIWNLLHGKGFRSYLDGGRLFLGEHVQVIHLLSIPLYVLWPSQILLELLQSACLALGAIPVYRIARRHSASSTAAALMAMAYLLYFPMQYLDIAVTLKTFRPNSFEIPLLLCALNALELRRYRAFLAWLAMTLLCQEDAAMVIAPLGVWIAMRQARFAGVSDRSARRRLAWFGWGLAVFGAAYVVVVVRVVLPWFRGGAEVHFAQYFEGLGTTSGEIAKNVLSDPGLLVDRWFNVRTWLFAVQLLAPLGLLPLLSPGRLAVAAPLFGVLALSEMTNSPLHHFHAPLVPILVWAAAGGMAQVDPLYARFIAWRHRRRRGEATDDERRHIPPEDFVASGKTLPAIEPVGARAPGGMVRPVVHARAPLIAASVWGMLCAFLTGVPMTFSPLGSGFWDPYSPRYWKGLYLPGERARRFPAVIAQIPLASRVASTDYIHPRFTHYDRSYDYSLYPREVPDDPEYKDPDYIVIDTRHPYSQIKRPEEVKEYRGHPERWELLDDKSGGYFLVFKRRRSSLP
jgi:uncharacterized membrane protein